MSTYYRQVDSVLFDQTPLIYIHGLGPKGDIVKNKLFKKKDITYILWPSTTEVKTVCLIRNPAVELIEKIFLLTQSKWGRSMIDTMASEALSDAFMLKTWETYDALNATRQKGTQFEWLQNNPKIDYVLRWEHFGQDTHRMAQELELELLFAPQIQETYSDYIARVAPSAANPPPPIVLVPSLMQNMIKHTLQEEIETYYSLAAKNKSI